MNKKNLYLSIGALLLIAACATNPLTGRKSLALISNTELFPQAFAQYSEVLKDNKVETNTKDAKMIENVGQRIKFAAEKYYSGIGKGSELKDYKWQFSLIQSDQLNAWCMPGGKVAFYTGILPVCKDETGVAVVMGHEIAHALAGHSREQVSNAMLAQGIMIGGNVAISNNQWRNVFNQLYPAGAGLTMLKYGRNMELDADQAGLYLMAMAGYDPREAVSFWQRMAAASNNKKAPPEYLSTHPNNESRIAQIQSIIPKALEYYNASPYKAK